MQVISNLFYPIRVYNVKICMEDILHVLDIFCCFYMIVYYDLYTLALGSDEELEHTYDYDRDD